MAFATELAHHFSVIYDVCHERKMKWRNIMQTQNIRSVRNNSLVLLMYMKKIDNTLVLQTVNEEDQ